MSRLLRVSAALAIFIGIILAASGAWGIYFTYANVAREKIVTPPDASIPNKEVLGPFTLQAQADIIREHVLFTTGGKTYAEMLNENTDRDVWITATTLTTALNLGVLTYAFSALTMLLGCISIWTGILFMTLSKITRLNGER